MLWWPIISEGKTELENWVLLKNSGPIVSMVKYVFLQYIAFLFCKQKFCTINKRA